jgi:tetratricopeptide (TPR) repeat protein
MIGSGSGAGVGSGSGSGGGGGGGGEASDVPARRPTPMAIPPTRPAGDDDGVVRLDCAAQQHSSTSAANTLAAAAAAAGLPPQAALDSAIAIQLAVAQINGGKVVEAELILDAVLVSHPKELGALVARGTARALRRELPGAIADFTAAIEVEPRYADTWKRRGQARSALGTCDDTALTDLAKAVELLPLMGAGDSAISRAECLLERAMVYQRRRDYRRAVTQLKEAVKLDPENHQMWNVLGLCATSQGDIRDGVAAYERAVALKPDLKEGFLNMAQALKEEGKTDDAERNFQKVLTLDAPNVPSMTAYRVMAQMRQQKGLHQDAVGLLTRALALKRQEGRIELLFQRAICHHALGYIREAVQDYDECMVTQGSNGKGNGGSGEEAKTLQYLCFYQKEMALYLYHSLDRTFREICLDAELLPLFKELWCKKGPPTAELISHYSSQPSVPSVPPRPPPPPDAVKAAALTVLADGFGRLLQNQHQGFLPNVRQQRAAGLAIVELAQAMNEQLAARRAGNTVWVSSAGSSVQAGASGRHQFGWRDLMDIVVKWRQVAEPNDQVVWVDLLTRREFEAGFGSHTPMFTGQTKCVRYYMNFTRAMALHKEVLLRDGHAFDAQNRPLPCGSATQRGAIQSATTAQDMYAVIGTDSWVVVHIKSVLRPGMTMEGTRLTLVKVPNQPDAFEFSIRTPVTPPRWKEFDAELEAAFEGIIAGMLSDDKPRTARAILTFAYYWYNFMPLARGTAACGYTTILALFWAAGMPVAATIPRDTQVDWEAILSQHPDAFVASVGAWLLPAAAREAPAATTAATTTAKAPGGGGGASGSGRSAAGVSSGKGKGAPQPAVFPPVGAVPAVCDVLSTLRARLEVLNGIGARRL